MTQHTPGKYGMLSVCSIHVADAGGLGSSMDELVVWRAIAVARQNGGTHIQTRREIKNRNGSKQDNNGNPAIGRIRRAGGERGISALLLNHGADASTGFEQGMPR